MSKNSDLSDFRSADTFDSTDVEARIDELEDSVTACDDCKGDGNITNEAGTLSADCKRCDGRGTVSTLDEDDTAELTTLIAFRAEVDSREWRYGITFIRDSHFRTYAQERAEDMAPNSDIAQSWPYTCIDWEYAAKELRYDYTGCDLDGIDFWYQS